MGHPSVGVVHAVSQEIDGIREGQLLARFLQIYFQLFAGIDPETAMEARG